MWRTAVLALLVGATCARAPVGAAVRSDGDGSALARVIARQLSADPRLCPYSIEVTAAGGVVHLDGIVDGPVDRARAEKIARDAGASRVANRLAVTAGSGDRGRC